MTEDIMPALDVFHPVYRELSDEEKDLMAQVKSKASELYELFVKVQFPDGDMTPSSAPKSTNNGREVSLAKTKLEEAVMWAVKGITK